MENINKEISANLLKEKKHSKMEEYLAVEQYVYDNIEFEYDWDNWLNIDYWPTASEVWEKKKEDCDGRAILAVSILRSRGFKSAKIVGNFTHIWVEVDQNEIMGPEKEKSIKTVKKGENKADIKISIPSRNLIFESLSSYIRNFPIMRNILLFTFLLIIFMHPCKDFKLYFIGFTICLWGLLFLQNWSISRISLFNISLIFGVFLLLASYIIPLVLSYKIPHK